MASAGQAQAHSSHPTHFSSPSGCRLSTCRPWYRGAVGFFSSGYSSVVTFLNIVRKVTPNPLPGMWTSDTGALLGRVARRGGDGLGLLAGQRRHRVPAGERRPPPTAAGLGVELLLVVDEVVGLLRLRQQEVEDDEGDEGDPHPQEHLAEVDALRAVDPHRRHGDDPDE